MDFAVCNDFEYIVNQLKLPYFICQITSKAQIIFPQNFWKYFRLEMQESGQSSDPSSYAPRSGFTKDGEGWAFQWAVPVGHWEAVPSWRTARYPGCWSDQPHGEVGKNQPHRNKSVKSCIEKMLHPSHLHSLLCCISHTSTPRCPKTQASNGDAVRGSHAGHTPHSHPTVLKGIQQQYLFLIPWTKTMCEDFTKPNNFSLVQGSGKICTYHGISSRELFVLIWVPSLVGILGLSNHIQDMCFHALHLASLQLRLGFW